MPFEFVGANVVIAARQFNPSIFSQLWLVRNQIATEDGFRIGCVFSDEVAKVETEQFGLLVIPPQLQLVPRGDEENRGQLVSDVVGTIVQRLPETPYTALGLNFRWNIWPDEGTTRDLARRLFYCNDRAVYQEFPEPDATFGAYMSKDALGCRLKLDIKPIDTSEDVPQKLHFAFNFHLDLSESVENDPVQARIARQLRQWDAAEQLATTIVEQAIQ